MPSFPAPYTDLHNLNLDWILQVVKDFQSKYTDFGETVANALADIETAKNQGLDELAAAVTAAQAAAQAAILEDQQAALTAIATDRAAALAAIDTDKAAALSALSSALTLALSGITAAQNSATAAIDYLYSTLPGDSAQILGELAIINSELAGNGVEALTWLQGQYLDNDTTITANSNHVSSQILGGAAGRRLKIHCETGYQISEVAIWRYIDTVLTHGGWTPLEADFNDVFPLDTVYFSIQITKTDYTSIAPTDIPGNVTVEWPTNFVNPADIAPVELSATAAYAHPAGSFFWYSGALRKATSDIASGASIVISGSGQNCEEAVLGNELYNLSEIVNAALPVGPNLFNAADCSIDGYYDGEGNIVGTGVYKSLAHPISLAGITGKYLYTNALEGAVDNVYFLLYRPNGDFRKAVINKYWSNPYLTDGLDGSVIVAVRNEFVETLELVLSDSLPDGDPQYAYYGRRLNPDYLPPNFDSLVDSKIDEYIILHPVGGVNNGMPQVAATYGAELAEGSWTTTGWDAVTNGYQNTNGNSSPLTLAIPGVSAGKLYYVEFTATSLDTNGRSEFTATVGGSNAFETYKGGGASMLFKYVIKAGSVAEGLKITPFSSSSYTWTGTITGISVKEITEHSVTAIIGISDDEETIVLQARAGDANSNFLGKNAGKDAILDELNVGFGYEVLANVTSGFWNTAIGAYALQKVVNGTRNVAIGYTALKNLDSGDRNIAIGTFAQRENVTGRNNIAVGADALQLNTGGERDVAIGTLAQNSNQGADSVAVGHEAMHTGTNVNRSVAIGSQAMKNATGGQNIGIGCEALRDRTGGNNVAVGYLAGKFGTSGHSNVFVGVNAGIRNNGNNNVIIGAQDIPEATDSSNNKVIIGNNDTDTVILGGKKLTFNQDGTVTWEALT